LRSGTIAVITSFSVHAAAQSAAPTPAQPAQPSPPAEASASPADAPPPGDHPAPNSIYAEGLGEAILYSINYERLVIDQLGIRAGFSYLSLSATTGAGPSATSANATYVFFPITASYIGLRAGKHSLELGGGATLLYVSGSANAAGISSSGSGLVPFGTLLVGYRFHPVDHAGFQFRVGFTSLIGNGLGLQNPDPSKLGFIPWPYLSLGASF
jgi:hypothetical protein